MLNRQNVARRLSSDSGMSLLEIMLAIAIAVVSISALTAIATTATRNVSNSRGHTIADQYARAAIAQMRNIRDNQGWAVLIEDNLTYAGDYEYFAINSSGELVAKITSNSDNYDCDHATVQGLSGIDLDGNNKQLIRTQLNSDQNELKIKAMVCYDFDSQNWSQVTLETVLTNWR